MCKIYKRKIWVLAGIILLVTMIASPIETAVAYQQPIILPVQTPIKGSPLNPYILPVQTPIKGSPLNPYITPVQTPIKVGTCLGDITGDSNVNSDDFVLFATTYDSVNGDLKYNVKADINNNGVINSEDFVLFASVYGKACSTTKTVPTNTPAPTPSYTETLVPVKSPQDYRRLDTGTFLVRAATGMGDLTIKNGIDFDALIVLSRYDMPKEAVIGLYIRSNDSYTILNIPDGTYILYYSLGKDWDNQLKEFSTLEGSSRFEEELKFETTSSFSTTYSATLYTIAGGNARTRYVDKSEFPRIG
jgi:hypothetical protein